MPLRPSTPAPVAARPSPAASRALQAEVRDPQRGAVVRPLFPPGSKPSTEALNSLILEAKQEYDRAKEQGNTGGMAAGHRRAEWLRTQGGTAGSDQSITDVLAQRQVGLNAGIVQAKTDYAAAAARGDQAAMAVAHARAEDLRRQGGGIAAAETLDESKLHLQAGVDRQVTAEKERFAAGTPAQQDLAHRRAEELRRAAGAQGVAVIGAGTSLVEARERASAEGNRQVLLDKVAHERAHSSGDAASQALLHRDAQAQRAAGASIGQHESVSEARTLLQLHLDQGIVAQKDAFASAGGAAEQEQARRRAEALREVGRSIDVKTIGQNVSLPDAQVKLVLAGGPLVAGGKQIAVQAADTERLRQAQAGIAAGAPNVIAMRRDYQAMLARARSGDVSAIAALAVLQRQADLAHVVLNPPPPPPPPAPARPQAPRSGGSTGEEARLRTQAAAADAANRFVALNAGEDARLRSHEAQAARDIKSTQQQAVEDGIATFLELEAMWEHNRAIAAWAIAPEKAVLVDGAALAAKGVEAAVVAVEKTDAAATLGARLKGVVASVGESFGVDKLGATVGGYEGAAGAASEAGALAERASLTEILRLDRFLKEAGFDQETRRRIVKAFGSGTRVEELAADTRAYRYFGNASKARGPWLTQELLKDPVNQLALPTGNAAEKVAEWVIPKGTKVVKGPVAPNFGRPGGADQVFLADSSVLQEVVRR